MKTLAIATAALGLALTASPALADNPESQSVDIDFAGIDLSTPEGQRILDQRIERAARQVCDVYQSRTGSRIRSREVRECLTQARASARSQVASIIEDQRRGG